MPALPAVRARMLCADAEPDGKAALEAFLKNISRPKMGQARAKQSAGQRAMDLSKQLSKLDGLTLDELLRIDGATLKEKGVPTQARPSPLPVGGAWANRVLMKGTRHVWDDIRAYGILIDWQTD